jgi:hypothetical protein
VSHCPAKRIENRPFGLMPRNLRDNAHKPLIALNECYFNAHVRLDCMKFSEIANRLTGISTQLVGVSWQPTDLEVPEHCVQSVLEIHHFLSGKLGKLDTGSEFGASLRAMKAAYRKFLERVGTDDREVILYANHHGHFTLRVRCQRKHDQ